jgi:hypothetical protein
MCLVWAAWWMVRLSTHGKQHVLDSAGHITGTHHSLSFLLMAVWRSQGLPHIPMNFSWLTTLSTKKWQVAGPALTDSTPGMLDYVCVMLFLFVIMHPLLHSSQLTPGVKCIQPCDNLQLTVFVSSATNVFHLNKPHTDLEYTQWWRCWLCVTNRVIYSSETLVTSC